MGRGNPQNLPQELTGLCRLGKTATGLSFYIKRGRVPGIDGQRLPGPAKGTAVGSGNEVVLCNLCEHSPWILRDPGAAELLEKLSGPARTPRTGELLRLGKVVRRHDGDGLA